MLRRGKFDYHDSVLYYSNDGYIFKTAKTKYNITGKMKYNITRRTKIIYKCLMEWDITCLDEWNIK